MSEKKQIVSRIHKFISKGLMNELDKICNNVIISDNNIKVKLIRAALGKFGVSYNELGPGTNRFAVHIDGYAFKIAMDDAGKLDNANEFAMSRELQPFVIKVYENNDLISVSEYVTLISREEFLDRREEILEVLSILGESYLLGDVGYTEKNFTNWGYRDNGDVVILDFAYIHYIEGREILCRKDGTMLEYTDNYHKMRCPKCGLTYTFSKIRAKIPIEKEWEYINLRKSEAHMLVEEKIFISKKDDGTSKVKEYYAKKERMESDMSKEEDYSVESNFGETFESDFSALLAAKRRREQNNFNENNTQANNNRPNKNNDKHKNNGKPKHQNGNPNYKKVAQEKPVDVQVDIGIKNNSDKNVNVNVNTAEEQKAAVTFEEALSQKAPLVTQPTVQHTTAVREEISQDKLEALAQKFNDKEESTQPTSLLVEANSTYIANVTEGKNDSLIVETIKDEQDISISVTKPPGFGEDKESKVVTETPAEKFERMAREHGFEEE